MNISVFFRTKKGDLEIFLNNLELYLNVKKRKRGLKQTTNYDMHF